MRTHTAAYMECSLLGIKGTCKGKADIEFMM